MGNNKKFLYRRIFKRYYPIKNHETIYCMPKKDRKWLAEHIEMYVYNIKTVSKKTMFIEVQEQLKRMIYADWISIMYNLVFDDIESLEEEDISFINDVLYYYRYWVLVRKIKLIQKMITHYLKI